ncbi:MAG TPA: hypothetical protein ENI97_00470 [Gammaproteobacteria bacterium]|nr:hypothetical protein [Gammaproteobacteria bacterium]
MRLVDTIFTTPSGTPSTTPYTQQRGAVLVVSLLILLVLTLIGVSSLDNSVMEEKMAANSQTATATFQAAESAISQAFYEGTLKSPALMVEQAQGATVSNRSTAGITSSSQVRMPAIERTTPLYNSSSGLFVSKGIEIVGDANIGPIRNRNVQGYTISPLAAGS